MDFSNLNIFDQAQDSQELSASLPTYYAAADNHNYGNGNFAFTDPTTWGTGLSNSGKFLVSAAVSGVNSLVNSGIAVANWAGADIEYNDTAAHLSALDSDLGRYYEENKQGADLAGFIVTSFLPGIAGVKLLNAGQKALTTAAQSGQIGGNLSRATGLLTPQVDTYRKLAAVDIATAQGALNTINVNTLKALGAGASQAVLESAAFETAVAATMFKSPILDDMDGWDLAKNIAMGTAFGGVVGGTFSGIKTFGVRKAAAREMAPLENQFTYIQDLSSVALPADRIYARTSALETLPTAPTSQQLLESTDPAVMKVFEGLDARSANEAADKLASKFARSREETTNKLNNLIREDIGAVAGKDKELADLLDSSLKGLPSNQVQANMMHATQATRLGDKLEIEKYVEKMTKKDQAYVPDQTVSYLKLTGEDAGRMSDEVPSYIKLGDELKSAEEVKATASRFGHSQKKIWNPLEAKSLREVDSRYIWARYNVKPVDAMVVHEFDFPVLEKVLEKWSAQVDLDINAINKITLTGKNGPYDITTADDLFKAVTAAKEEAATQALSMKSAGAETPWKTIDDISLLSNVKKSYLEGEQSTDVAGDFFARQAADRDYTAAQVKKGLHKQNAPEIDTSLIPSAVKLSYSRAGLEDVNGMVLEGMANIKQQQKLYQQAVENTLATHMPQELYSQLPVVPEDLLLQAHKLGPGVGIASAANEGYGALGSTMQYIGSITNRWRMLRRSGIDDTLSAPGYQLLRNTEAAVEFNAISNNILKTSEHYVLNEAGTSLIPRKLKEYQDAVAGGAKGIAPPKFAEGTPLDIPIKNAATRDAIIQDITLNDARIRGYKDIRAAQGLEDHKFEGTFYPKRPDPKDYSYYAVVVDPTVTAVGHKSMIHAASAKELEALISKVPNTYKVMRGKELDDYFKANGEYDYSRTLHENYIDADLKRAGAYSSFFPATDPAKIVTDWVNYHKRAEDIFVREAMNARYEKEFTELRRLGESITATATSKFGGSYKYAESSVKNPYLNYIKVALDLSQNAEYPLLQGLNSLLEKSWTAAADTITAAFTPSKSLDELDKINGMLKQYGISPAYQDAATVLLANHSAPKGELLNFVRRANSVLATVVLRLDPFNAINNAVGSTVLLGAETKSVLRAMEKADTTAVGKLASLMQTQVPGVEGTIKSPSKLIGNAYKRYFSQEEGPALKELYEKNGWITSVTKQFDSMIDDISLKGVETPADMTSRLQKAVIKAKGLAERGETLTGNKHAEELNRFVAADVMKQITDVAVEAGVLSEREQFAYINTFVNRTQGNILASQRPLMFQGAVGQAVGLFQTYQFNMLQQIFRHIGEGSAKDAAFLLGMQSTVYGLNGLPAFNFVNNHIVADAAGNQGRADLYTGVYGVFGKTAGDWLLYGAPSNLLRANLYTRGDINPRHPTVIPVNPLDIPLVDATVRSFQNIYDMATKVGQGGSLWNTFLQGIEHNGLSRPLAGFAQMAQGYSTTSKGNIFWNNDFNFLSNLTRVAGAKPLDESIARDAAFRFSSYAAADLAKRNELAEAVKTSVIGGATPSESQVEQFATAYAKIGGGQKDFNKWMMNQIKKANTSQAEKLATDLKSPYSQSMQRIVGGIDTIAGY